MSLTTRVVPLVPMLDHLWKYVATFTVALSVVFLLTPVVKRVAFWIGAIDLPGERRIHTAPVPRIGGLGIFVAFHLSCLFAYFVTADQHIAGDITYQWWLNYLVVSSGLLLVGLLDDLRGLGWIVKLSAQAAAASLMYIFDVRLGHILGFELPFLLDFPLTLFWFIGLTNAFNLIDGLDGLAAGLALIAALGLLSVSIIVRLPLDSLVILAVMGACFGFLFYNFHPASIFLGDSGSQFLGFTLAAISLSSGAQTSILLALGVPLLAMGVPIFDTFLAIWRRTIRSALSSAPVRRWGAFAKADMEHLHHRLLENGFNQRKTAVALYLLNLALVSVAILVLLNNSRIVGIALLTTVAMTYVIVRHLARVELWDSGTLILRGISRPTSPILASILYPVIDLISMLCALYLTLLVVPAFGSDSQLIISDRFVQGLVPWCAIPLAFSILSGTYRRVWSKARISEYATTFLALLAGILASAGISLLGTPSALREVANFGLVFYASVISLFFSMRIAPRAILDLMSTSSTPARLKPVNAIIYGAGNRGLLYLKRQSSSIDKVTGPINVLGFIDDDLNLRGRIVYGHRVLGSHHELEKILAERKVDRLVIAASIPNRQLEKIAALGHSAGCQVEELVLSTRPVSSQAAPTRQIALGDSG